MLNVSLTTHRNFLPADTPDQRLFLMMKIRPQADAAKSRPSTTFAFLIDTSGSMYDKAGNGEETSKLEVVIKSLKKLLHSGRLNQEDRLALIRFDSEASTIIGLTPATEISKIESAIDQLTKFSGGTCLGRGLEEVLSLLEYQVMTSKRVLIFTDGQTIGEEDCRQLAARFAGNNIPVTALGIGDYNEELLVNLSDTTGGQLGHIVAGTPSAHQIAISDFPNYIIQAYQQAQNEVINNIKLDIRSVKGVNLNKITRVYPDQAEYSLSTPPYPMGNAIAADDTIYILEFNIDSRTSSRARIAQIGLTYDIPGLNRRGEQPPLDVVVQFLAGQGGAAQVNQEVMGYVQQRNIGQLVGDATKVADQDPEKAEKLLETARRMTVKIGNNEMLASLNQASDELRKTRKISANTRKTVKMGSRGKTVKMNSDINDELASDAAIRNLTGT
ncbi:MAG: VWA domain-containing protein [Crocosphaera sp.]|nr:VWA domain-containing protein [Crocosphaera sp.]